MVRGNLQHLGSRHQAPKLCLRGGRIPGVDLCCVRAEADGDRGGGVRPSTLRTGDTAYTRNHV